VSGLRDSARAGAPLGLFVLGQMHSLGRDMEANEDSARVFWRRAALKGYPQAMHMIGWSLQREGRTAEARRILRQALANGHESAYETLATTFLQEHFIDGDVSALPPDTLAAVVRTLRASVRSGAPPARTGLDYVLSSVRTGASNDDPHFQRHLRHLRREGLLDDSTGSDSIQSAPGGGSP
jgi:plasmid stability protein